MSQIYNIFLEASWDLVGETENGTEDIWWILEGQNYPSLLGELIPENWFTPISWDLSNLRKLEYPLLSQPAILASDDENWSIR